jgi:hypothetical protein
MRGAPSFAPRHDPRGPENGGIGCREAAGLPEYQTIRWCAAGPRTSAVAPQRQQTLETFGEELVSSRVEARSACLLIRNEADEVPARFGTLAGGAEERWHAE